MGIAHPSAGAPGSQPAQDGSATNYPLNSRTVVSHIPALIVHDEHGLRALSFTCSHLGCVIKERNFGFEYPCHSSRYDPEGQVIQGPASADLKKLPVNETEDGNLHVFTA